MERLNYRPLYDELKAVAVSEGMTLFGVASLEDIRASFHETIAGIASQFDRAISVGYRLPDAVVEDIEDRPTLLYARAYKTANWLLDQTAARLAAHIHRAGGNAVPVPASQIVDWETQLGHLSHKSIGREAGHGWIGKSGLLVNTVHGARVRYATVLTDAPLPPEAPGKGGCGECRNCIEMCPAGAISEEGYDKQKCLDKLKEFVSVRGIGQYICGVCVKACPTVTSTTFSRLDPNEPRSSTN
jgi:epoxyqueuosine reductase QueG